MRIMFDNNPIPEIEEITLFSAVPCWKPGSDTTKDAPSMFSLFAVRAGEERGDYIGEWIIDGTPEAYQAARNNYTGIIKQLHIFGYIAQSDFINFKWY